MNLKRVTSKKKLDITLGKDIRLFIYTIYIFYSRILLVQSRSGGCPGRKNVSFSDNENKLIKTGLLGLIQYCGFQVRRYSVQYYNNTPDIPHKFYWLLIVMHF